MARAHPGPQASHAGSHRACEQDGAHAVGHDHEKRRVLRSTASGKLTEPEVPPRKCGRSLSLYEIDRSGRGRGNQCHMVSFELGLMF